MNVFIDTSALTKLYHREKGTDALFEFVSRRKSELLVIVSDITRIEFRSVFYRKMRMQEISPERVAGVVELFEGDMEFRFRVVEVQSDVKKLAVDVFDSLGPKSSLRTLDALQLATALSVHKLIEVHKFICSDKQLLTCAKPYFDTFNPETEAL